MEEIMSAHDHLRCKCNTPSVKKTQNKTLQGHPSAAWLVAEWCVREEQWGVRSRDYRRVSNCDDAQARFFINSHADYSRIITYFNGYYFFHTEEGLYTRNVCVNRQVWHFVIIVSLIINIIFKFTLIGIRHAFLPQYKSVCWNELEITCVSDGNYSV